MLQFFKKKTTQESFEITGKIRRIGSLTSDGDLCTIQHVIAFEGRNDVITFKVNPTDFIAREKLSTLLALSAPGDIISLSGIKHTSLMKNFVEIDRVSILTLPPVI